MKDYDKNKESSYLEYWDVNNLYGWAISQKLLVDGFKQVENASQFNKEFPENYIEVSDEGYFLEGDVLYPENLDEFHDDLPFLIEEMKIKKVEKRVANLHDENTIHNRNFKKH